MVIFNSVTSFFAVIVRKRVFQQQVNHEHGHAEQHHLAHDEPHPKGGIALLKEDHQKGAGCAADDSRAYPQPGAVAVGRSPGLRILPGQLCAVGQALGLVGGRGDFPRQPHNHHGRRGQQHKGKIKYVHVDTSLILIQVIQTLQ